MHLLTDTRDSGPCRYAQTTSGLLESWLKFQFYTSKSTSRFSEQALKSKAAVTKTWPPSLTGCVRYGHLPNRRELNRKAVCALGGGIKIQDDYIRNSTHILLTSIQRLWWEKMEEKVVSRLCEASFYLDTIKYKPVLLHTPINNWLQFLQKWQVKVLHPQTIFLNNVRQSQKLPRLFV